MGIKKIVSDLKKNPKTRLIIRKEGDACLTAPNADIVNFDDQVLKPLVINMVYTMNSVRGVGLAAPQIGRNINLAIALINKMPLVLINPKISGHPEERNVSIEEGCLSCPNEAVRIPRYEWIRVDYDDLKGRRQWLELRGIDATIVQHELDHLNGKLITDYKENVNTPS